MILHFGNKSFELNTITSAETFIYNIHTQHHLNMHELFHDVLHNCCPLQLCPYLTKTSPSTFLWYLQL